MAQVVGGVVGGAVGFMVGGIAGAAIGFSLGAALGAATQTMPGARIGEIARQTAKEGDPRTIVWGIVRPIGPNLIASEDPPRIVRRKESGKGGPRVESESVYRTYALGVCEGPITGYRRIWRNNKLVYDARGGSEWGEQNNFVFLERATLYLGTFDQMPDPSLEIVFGVGNVPAHRGTAYVVMADEDLTDLGGAVPQWIFEVERGYGTILTSRPYPIIASEGAQSTGGWVRVEPRISSEIEQAESTGGAVISGVFKESLITYGTLEEAESLGGAVVSGVFRRVLVTYDDGLPEESESLGGAVISGVFKISLVKYTNGEPEEVQSGGGAVISGVHS